MNLVELAETVRGWCPVDQGWALYQIASSVPTGTRVVEIGSWQGRSAVWLGAGARDAGAKMLTIDHHKSPRGRRANLAALQANLKRLGLDDTVEVVNGVSLEVAATYLQRWGEPISALYIDGDHRTGAAIADFSHWTRHGLNPMIVAIDDASYPGPAELLQWLEAESRWRTLGEVGKRMVWGEWVR